MSYFLISLFFVFALGIGFLGEAALPISDR